MQMAMLWVVVSVSKMLAARLRMDGSVVAFATIVATYGVGLSNLGTSLVATPACWATQPGVDATGVEVSNV